MNPMSLWTTQEALHKTVPGQTEQIISPHKTTSIPIPIPKSVDNASEFADEKTRANEREQEIYSASQMERFAGKKYGAYHWEWFSTEQEFTFSNHAAFKIFSHTSTFICHIFVTPGGQPSDLLSLYHTLAQSNVTWCPRLRNPPQLGGNFFWFEEDFDPEFHGGCTLGQLLNEVSFSRLNAIDICLALESCVAFMHAHNYSSIDYSPNNLAVRIVDDRVVSICPLDFSGVIGEKRIPDRLRFGELGDDFDFVDYIRLPLCYIPHAFEVHAIWLAKNDEGNHPFTYAELKPIDIFNVGLTLAYVLLQDENAIQVITDAIQEVDDFTESGCYRAKVEAVLPRLIEASPLVIVRGREALCEFLLEVYGSMDKVGVGYKSRIETARWDIDDLLQHTRELKRVPFKCLGHVECSTNMANELQTRELLSCLRNPYSLRKISNQNTFFGRKQCVTYEAIEDEDQNLKAIYRVFFKNTERGVHVYNCYTKIKFEQDANNPRALKCFPRVQGIHRYGNVFVVYEAHVGNGDILDYLEKSVSGIPIDVYRKCEQVHLAAEVFEPVVLLHEWGFTHGDVGIDNFVKTGKSSAMLIDLESSVDQNIRSSTELIVGGIKYHDFLKLHLWTKRNYDSFEIEESRKRSAETFIRLEGNDTFAALVLAFEILTLSQVDKKKDCCQKGEFSSQLFERNVRYLLESESVNPYDKARKFETKIFEELFQPCRHVERCAERLVLANERCRMSDIFTHFQNLVSFWEERLAEFESRY